MLSTFLVHKIISPTIESHKDKEIQTFLLHSLGNTMLIGRKYL
jgi:hypothetical protein